MDLQLLERIKEIGVIRSLGGRKRDVAASLFLTVAKLPKTLRGVDLQ